MISFHAEHQRRRAYRENGVNQIGIIAKLPILIGSGDKWRAINDPASLSSPAQLGTEDHVPAFASYTQLVSNSSGDCSCLLHVFNELLLSDISFGRSA